MGKPQDVQAVYEEARRSFLRYAVFGSEPNQFRAVSRLAYRDMCRTLRLRDADALALRAAADAYLENEARGVLGSRVSKAEFDSWHQAVCENLKQLYTRQHIRFTIGQAQKWVNMMFKYLFVLDTEGIETLLPFLHVPVDSVIMAAAKKRLQIAWPGSAWSVMDDYGLYYAFQQEIREKAETAPLLWEMDAWVGEAGK